MEGAAEMRSGAHRAQKWLVKLGVKVRARLGSTGVARLHYFVTFCCFHALKAIFFFGGPLFKVIVFYSNLESLNTASLTFSFIPMPQTQFHRWGTESERLQIRLS